MPNIGYYHPIIIHFAIAFLVAGVIARLVSLTGRARFAGPVAVVLLLVGTFATFAAVKSGADAHGPAERVPGARAAVVEHEELGERARNVFAAVALLEILGLRPGTKSASFSWPRASSASSVSSSCTRPPSTAGSSSIPTRAASASAPEAKKT